MPMHPGIRTRVRSKLTLTLIAVGCALVPLSCEPAISSTPKAQRSTADGSSGAASGDSTLGFPYLPDPAKTPGAALDVTAADICVPGYSKRVRNVPSEIKRRAYALYGVRRHEPGEYEIDHLINLSLGGSNSIRNLWPESFRTSPWNAYVKDALETELHRRVCAGTLELAKAQQVIARNWIAGYRQYVHPTPLPAGPRRLRQRPAHNAQQPRSTVP